MDPERTTEILRALRGNAPAGEDCLAPEQLAAFFDGGLCTADRAEAEEHLADCDYCLGQAALITRSRGDSAAAGVPSSISSQAQSVGQRRAAAPRRRLLSWALAAVLVLTVGMFAVQLAPINPAGDTEPLRQTRLADPKALQPRLLAPAEGSVISPLEQVFRWNEVEGSLYYDVRLVDPDGNLVLRERVASTRWLIPETVLLEPGEEYFVRIDAYLSDAKFLSSEHVVFTVGEDD